MAHLTLDPDSLAALLAAYLRPHVAAVRARVEGGRLHLSLDDVPTGLPLVRSTDLVLSLTAATPPESLLPAAAPTAHILVEVRVEKALKVFGPVVDLVLKFILNRITRGMPGVAVLDRHHVRLDLGALRLAGQSLSGLIALSSLRLPEGPHALAAEFMIRGA